MTVAPTMTTTDKYTQNKRMKITTPIQFLSSILSLCLFLTLTIPPTPHLFYSIRHKMTRLAIAKRPVCVSLPRESLSSVCLSRKARAQLRFQYWPGYLRSVGFVPRTSWFRTSYQCSVNLLINACWDLLTHGKVLVAIHLSHDPVQHG